MIEGELPYDTWTILFSLQAQEEQFLDKIMDIVTLKKTLLYNLLNFDQTNVRLVAPQPKTVSPIGTKQAN